MPKIQVNGIHLYYESTGHGQALVFIHGLGSSGRDWELQVKEFSRVYRVITFDLRGHGLSDKPAGPYSLSLFAADTAALLKALEIKSAHIVGLSLGGGVAFQLAVDFPALVKTLVIINSAPEFAARTFKEKMEIFKRSAIVRFLGMRKMGEVLSKRLFLGDEHKSLRALFVERWAENDPRAFQDAMRALTGWSVKDRLGSIQCPALVIAADQDYTPLAWKEEYTALMPGAQIVVIPDAHHAVPVEKPEEFNTVLAEFLNGKTGKREKTF
ncbi:MAG TPA: alpha/beta hydrolase [Candidatus Omnitrophota bacterium]|jgi:pimeloyl-ACP methyl ester carboxylesterase|nr:alpha/beta hydrolase [Candidatus Omnitrophota bacterium]HSA30761.1 alpha/beta hydrolase [Candidatus Omnitrophota bacterium]